MRMRSRFSYKFIIVAACFAILLLLGLNYYYKTPKNHDEFITQLESEADSAENEVNDVVITALNWSNQLQQHSTEAGHLLNLTDFHYMLQSDVCSKPDAKELLAILIVTSYVGHDELRSAHRQAIAQSKLEEMGMQRVFLLAQIPQHENFMQQKQLIAEQNRFGDLLQGSFVEAYRNLSYKHIMGLKWAAEKCNKAKFIVKMDDDIIYDVFQLRRYLESLELENSELIKSAALLAGYLLDSKPPIRNVANKWYVAPREYAHALYPPYLSGWLYITNAGTAARLVNAAQHASSIFWIDDTWVTGILRDELKIPMQKLNSWYSANAEFMDCCVRDLKVYAYECEYYVGPNGGDSKLLIEFLHNVEKCYFDECAKRPSSRALKKTCVAGAKHILPAHGQAMIQPMKLR